MRTIRAFLLAATMSAGAGCGLPAGALPAPAPAFLLSDPDGRPIRGPASSEGRAGERGVTVVEFFATWCPACRGHVPTLNALHGELGGRGVSVLAVALGGRFGVDPVPDPESVRAFVRDCSVRYPVALADGRVVGDYARAVGAGIHFIPTTFVIDPAGRIVSRHVGGVDQETLLSEVRALLAGSAPAVSERSPSTDACPADGKAGPRCRKPAG